MLRILDESELVAAEDVAGVHVLEAVGVRGEHAGDAARQRRIDEHVGRRKPLRVDQRRDVEQQFLRPFDGEDRNDEVAARRQRVADLMLKDVAALGH